MRRLIALGLILIPLGAWAEEGRFDNTVRDLFFSGFAGVPGDLAKGMAICEAALKENPDNPEALVWHGTGDFFRGGAAFRAGNVAEGQRLRAQGLAEMDRAVALRPHSPSTLAARAPALFVAAKYAPAPIAEPWLRTAMSDFEELAAINQQRSDLSEHDKGEVLGALAEGWDRLGDSTRSHAYLERIRVELPAQSNYAQRAGEWLRSGRRPDRMTCLGCHKNPD